MLEGASKAFTDFCTNTYNYVTGHNPAHDALPRVNPTAQMNFQSRVTDMTFFDQVARQNFRYIDAACSSFKSAVAAACVVYKCAKFVAFPIKEADVFGNKIDNTWTNLGKTFGQALVTTIKATVVGVFNLIISPPADLIKSYYNPQIHTAYLVIDIDKPFLIGGSLEVPGTDEAHVQLVANLAAKFDKKLRFRSVDSHPAGHLSFASNATKLAVDKEGKKVEAAVFSNVLLDGAVQTLWPDHCIWKKLPGSENTPDEANGKYQVNDGPDLLKNMFDEENVVNKGIQAHVDSYSAVASANGKYPAVNANKVGLVDQLRNAGVKKVVVDGIATNFCVAFSVLDLLKNGFEVELVVDACRGIVDELSPEGMKMREMVALMTAKGAKIVKSATILDKDYDVQKGMVVPAVDYDFNNPNQRIKV